MSAPKTQPHWDVFLLLSLLSPSFHLHTAPQNGLTVSYPHLLGPPKCGISPAPPASPHEQGRKAFECKGPPSRPWRLCVRRHLAVHSRLHTSWNAPLDKLGCLQRAAVRRFHMGEMHLWTWWGLAFTLASARIHLVIHVSCRDNQRRSQILGFGS